MPEWFKGTVLKTVKGESPSEVRILSLPPEIMKNKTPDNLTWEAPDREHTTRAPVWYLLFGLVGLALILFGIYNHSLIMIVTFSIMIVSVLILSVQKPQTITYQATKTGLVANNVLYPYKIIKTFWIIYNPPRVKILNFETAAYLNNRITFQLNHQDPVELRWFLKQYLPEDLDRNESVTETLARTLQI